MTVLRWLLLHFCDVAAAVACAGGWVLRELLAGFPVAVGGMKGARPARVPCAISFTLLVETLRVPWGCVSFADGIMLRRVLSGHRACPAPQRCGHSRLCASLKRLGTVGVCRHVCGFAP